MHREPDVGFDPGSPGSRPGPKAGAKPLHHPGIPFVGISDSMLWSSVTVSFSHVFFFFNFMYLFMRERQRDRETERQREAETQAEGKAGSMQGA